MVLYLAKMWTGILIVMGVLFWPMVMFATHPADYEIWIPVMFGWPAFVLLTIYAVITKDMPGPFDPPPPPSFPTDQ